MPDLVPDASALGLSEIVHLESAASTMDEVHVRARDGAGAGLLVIADRQESGRGRGGNRWTSETGAGLWMTLLERPSDAATLGVLSLRTGLALAGALAPFADGQLAVKWPNDLFVVPPRALDGPGDRRAVKLSGILIEARWREQSVDWVAIGVGINLRALDVSVGALRPGVRRSDVLRAVVPALRAAASGGSMLGDDELARWAAHDIAHGLRVVEPTPGTVQGITADGALRVRTDDGRDVLSHAGSLRFAEGVSPLAPSP